MTETFEQLEPGTLGLVQYEKVLLALYHATLDIIFKKQIRAWLWRLAGAHMCQQHFAIEHSFHHYFYLATGCLAAK